MKTRIISGAVGVVVLIGVLLLHRTVVFPICLALIAGLAIFELFRAKGCKDFRISLLASLLYALSHPILEYFGWERISSIVLLGAVMLIFLNGILQHTRLKIENVIFMVAVTILVPYSFGLLVTLEQSDEKFGLISVILALCSAWVADTGAYFTGTFLGKHKLCPEISPKKTVEGFVGGIAVTMIVFLAFYLIYGHLAGVAVHYVWGTLIAGVCAVISVLGDLTASLLKRQYGIKDFGNIMPGHGGVMDRFDSVLFTIPTFCLMNMLLPIFTAA